MKSLIKRGVLGIAKRSQMVENLAAYITRNGSPNTKDTYLYLRNCFVANGKGHEIGEAARSELVEKFEQIDKSVPMGSSPTDGLFLAEMLLNIRADGEVVECGCYAGGSSAKLSLVVKLLGRQLTIFDSFEGLPAVEGFYLKDQHCRRSDEWVTEWSGGKYSARLDEVQANIERFGDASVCKQVKGWFSDTLTPDNLPQQIGFVFADVDLANSARDCFVASWPRLSEQGVYVTHDTAYIKVSQEGPEPGPARTEVSCTVPRT
jgi:O-methyltransferase